MKKNHNNLGYGSFELNNNLHKTCSREIPSPGSLEESETPPFTWGGVKGDARIMFIRIHMSYIHFEPPALTEEDDDLKHLIVELLRENRRLKKQGVVQLPGTIEIVNSKGETDEIITVSDYFSAYQTDADVVDIPFQFSLKEVSKIRLTGLSPYSKYWVRLFPSGYADKLSKPNAEYVMDEPKVRLEEVMENLSASAELNKVLITGLSGAMKHLEKGDVESAKQIISEVDEIRSLFFSRNPTLTTK